MIILRKAWNSVTCRLGVLCVAFWFAIAGAGPAAADDEPDFFTVGVGAFDMNDDETAAELDLQFRLKDKFWIFKPQFGVFITSDEAFYAYAGLYIDIYFGRRWVLSPSTAIGAFEEGDGKDLGGPLEFRSALELAYRFDDRSRLGLQFGHLSNASIHDDNPGEEFFILNYSIPTDIFSR